MKARHNPTFVEERALAHDIELKLALSTKNLMAKYDVSRTVVSRVTREVKLRFRLARASRAPPNLSSNSLLEDSCENSRSLP